jgi:hypothetical protein
MKSFKDFIHSPRMRPILIPVDPVHGKHSRPANDEPMLIPVDPVHGAHSKPRDKMDEDHVGAFYSAMDKRPEPSNEHRQAIDWANHNDNAHLGGHLDAVHNAISIPQDHFTSTPNAEHLKQYTEMSATTNHDLLQKAKHEPLKYHETHTLLNNKVKAIDKALGSRKLKHDLHVYHGTSQFNPGELAAQHPEGHIKTAAYMSTSIDKRKAAQFSGTRVTHDYPNKGEFKPAGPHVIHLHLKPKQKGIYMGDHSAFPEEHEFILPRNTTMKIHPEPEVLHNGTHVWHAHVVDSKE